MPNYLMSSVRGSIATPTSHQWVSLFLSALYCLNGYTTDWLIPRTNHLNNSANFLIHPRGQALARYSETYSPHR